MSTLKQFILQGLIGYRTIIVCIIQLIVGVLYVTDWNAFVADPKAGLSLIGFSISIAILRFYTKTPIFKGPPQ